MLSVEYGDVGMMLEFSELCLDQERSQKIGEMEMIRRLYHFSMAYSVMQPFISVN